MSELSQRFFRDPEEELVAVLGRSNLAPAVAGDASTSIVILTDRCVYFHGRIFDRKKVFEFTRYGTWAESRGRRIVTLEGTTGSGFSRTPMKWLVSGWCLLVAGQALNLKGCDGYARAAGMMGPMGPYDWAMMVWGFIGAVIGIVLLIVHATRTLRLFVVNTRDGAIATPCAGYDTREIRAFAEALAAQRSRLGGSRGS